MKQLCTRGGGSRAGCVSVRAGGAGRVRTVAMPDKSSLTQSLRPVPGASSVVRKLVTRVLYLVFVIAVPGSLVVLALLHRTAIESALLELRAGFGRIAGIVQGTVTGTGK
jgi:hypothetical protein